MGEDNQAAVYGEDYASVVWDSDFVKNNLQMKVREMINGNKWEIPIEFGKAKVQGAATDVCTATSYHSPLVKEVWFTAACATMRELWFQKNLILFDNGKVNTHKFKSKILQVVHEGGIRMKDRGKYRSFPRGAVEIRNQYL
ncbi:hypothetical protein C5167_002837 [Papaver somniferum]|uniref:Uncharacterized protein n=1 Tax=Papaver somniferum TaxID=3469 RepID=A0A4Y7L385_PAPSO|nr:hypothetical protein C5167_002837 [Papaver somniferum]